MHRARADRRMGARAVQRVAPPPPPSSRTKWTRRVPRPVLIGHAASLTPYVVQRVAQTWAVVTLALARAAR